MKRNLKPRADLDDGDLPAFVNEPTVPEKLVPQCLRCGGKFPKAKALWIICEACANRDLEIQSGSFTLTSQGGHNTSTGALIGQLAGEMARQLSTKDGDRTPLPPASVLHHLERLKARGLDEGAARRLAESMALDPQHRAECPFCRGDLAAIVAQLEKPSQDTERLARIGRDHLPRWGLRS